ncbi:MAG: hypothetical protein HC927_07600 [Deltaproteobacteria bacterium]|nr:hypothetical protein [Deltaproteobacteria bacterium]
MTNKLADPRTLAAHPDNPRIHPAGQSASLRATIGHIGVIKEVIVNQRTGRLLNGHLRVQLAIEEGIEALPTKYVDLDEQEERLLLALFDHLAEMADVDHSRLTVLLDDLPAQEGRLQALIAEIRTEYAPRELLDDGQGDLAVQNTARLTIDPGVRIQIGPIRMCAPQEWFDRWQQTLPDADNRTIARIIETRLGFVPNPSPAD